MTHFRNPSFLLSIFLPISSLFGFMDAFQHRQKYDLQQEIALVQSTVMKLPPGEKLLALGAEEFYLFTGHRAFWKYQRLDRQQENFIRWFEPEGCGGVIQKFRTQSPGLVILRPINPNQCWQQIEKEILTQYQESSIRVPGPRRPFTLRVYSETPKS